MILYDMYEALYVSVITLNWSMRCSGLLSAAFSMDSGASGLGGSPP